MAATNTNLVDAQIESFVQEILVRIIAIISILIDQQNCVYFDGIEFIYIFYKFLNVFYPFILCI